MQNKIIFSAQYIRQFGFPLITFLIFVLPAWPASVSQRTEGSCSPAVADVKGDVKMSIVCEGVDPALLNEIVKILNEILKDTKNLEQIRQELDRTGKRTDQIEARQAPRRLTLGQRSQLIALLSGKPAALVQLVAVANDAEAMQYVKALGSTLVAAGWKVQGIQQLTLLGDVPIGVQIWIKSQKDTLGAQILVEALRKVGINAAISENERRSPTMIDLIVGAKPLQ